MTVTTARPVPCSTRPCSGQPRYRSDSSEWNPHPGAVSFARRRTRLRLAEWGLDELAEDAAQLVSETMANAVEAHQREGLSEPVRLTLVAGLGAVLLIVVRDFGTGMPTPEHPADDDENGRGLLIVQALAARWDIKQCREGGGKVVRALLVGQRRGGRPDRGLDAVGERSQ